MLSKRRSVLVVCMFYYEVKFKLFEKECGYLFSLKEVNKFVKKVMKNKEFVDYMKVEEEDDDFSIKYKC
ncbi:hypothetical protein Syn6312_2894 [Synechococcus sp. PCC 6312]|nr:hypothetical protein Syn6312_2894 [Synechococcus sp. PCC 6312]